MSETTAQYCSQHYPAIKAALRPGFDTSEDVSPSAPYRTVCNAEECMNYGEWLVRSTLHIDQDPEAYTLGTTASEAVVSPSEQSKGFDAQSPQVDTKNATLDLPAASRERFESRFENETKGEGGSKSLDEKD